MNADRKWAEDLPLFARGMVLAGQTLFVAGPADLLDEEKAFKSITESKTQSMVRRQADAYAGRLGAILWAVSAEDGKKRYDCWLDSPPVWDGLIAANGSLYLADMDGYVRCLSGLKN